MSLDATIWAWKQKIGDSSAKLVLLSLADRAGADFKAYPSVASLAADTDLNRKTIINALSRLKALGLIEDTGERKGSSGRVIVYRMIGITDRTKQSLKGDNPKNGTINTKNTNSPKNGTVPILPVNSPENGTTNSPNIGTRNQSGEPVSEPVDADASNSTVTVTENNPKSDQPIPDLTPNLFDKAIQEDLNVAQLRNPQDRNRFAMHWEWVPGQSFAERCRSMGIPLSNFDADQSEAILAEFRSYWESRGDVFNQGQWEHKLAQRIQRECVDRKSASNISSDVAQNRAQQRAGVSAAIMNVQDTNW